MATVTLQEAQTRLSELIHSLGPGEELTIVEDETPIAKLRASTPQIQRKPRRPGSLRGTVLGMAPDFDAPLDDFKEY